MSAIDVVGLVGNSVQSKSGDFNAESLRGKVVAFYFSAHWCSSLSQQQQHATLIEGGQAAAHAHFDTLLPVGQALLAARSLPC